MADVLSLREYYALPAFVTFASLAQQGRFARRVGLARMKFNVPVPETTGDPGFVRVFRAHQNCAEFYPSAVTSLWLSSVFCHPVAASVLGIVYMYGRQRYYDGYEQAAEKRWPGFKISVGALLMMLALSGAGTTTALLKRYTDIDLGAYVTAVLNKVLCRQ